MKPPESAIAQSERHVREGEERIARQTALVERLDRAGHEHRAEQARQMLATLQQCLETAREHLRIQCQMRDGAVFFVPAVRRALVRSGGTGRGAFVGAGVSE